MLVSSRHIFYLDCLSPGLSFNPLTLPCSITADRPCTYQPMYALRWPARYTWTHRRRTLVWSWRKPASWPSHYVAEIQATVQLVACQLYYLCQRSYVHSTRKLNFTARGVALNKYRPLKCCFISSSRLVNTPALPTGRSRVIFEGGGHDVRIANDLRLDSWTRMNSDKRIRKLHRRGVGVEISRGVHT
jgi:hypothetical protein